ncbi:Large exoprotein involved in heme utilization or adhesion [Synechococcus sp. WH 8109]|nr:Large exoprotein involved in heme utilization or adhesion [Synechococcus sp. WH 8109]
MSLDDRLYQSWLLQLQTWAADGRLFSAGVDALRLKPGQATDQLKRIATRLAKGETQDLPPVELLPGSAMPGAAGAFAHATGTIYVNQDWLQASNPKDIANLLTEEYGHYLDNQLNKTDTAGDEGAAFAEQLLGAANNSLQSYKNNHFHKEDDHGYININGNQLEAEFQNFYGTDGADNFNGTGSSDTMYGYGGADFLKGGGGSDYIYGGGGADKIRGKWSGDLEEGSGAFNYLFGGEGDDIIWGASKKDIMRGDGNQSGQESSDNEGNDVLKGNGGNDLLTGGKGHDRLDGGGGKNIFDGGPGADIIWGGGYSREDVYQHDGDSVIWTDAGNLGSSATLINDETITFGNGVDVIYNFSHTYYNLYLPNNSFNLLSSGDALTGLTIGQNYFIQGSWSKSGFSNHSSSYDSNDYSGSFTTGESTSSDQDYSFLALYNAQSTDFFNTNNTNFLVLKFNYNRAHPTDMVADIGSTNPLNGQKILINGPNGNAGDSSTSFSLAENNSAVHTFSNTGSVPGTKSIFWSLAGGADKSLFSINESTGALSFDTAPIYGNNTDANSDGTYEVDVMATLGNTGSTTSERSIELGSVNTWQSVSITITDATAPTVQSVSSSTADGTYKAGDVININVLFSEAVTVNTTGGTPQLTLETGSTDQTVSYSSGSGTNTLAFSYTVQNGDTSADLNYKATSSLALNGATIRDAAGNNATLTLPALASSDSLAGNSALVIDGSAPTVQSVSSSTADGTYKAGDVININVLFSEAVTVNTTGGTPQLTLETGSTDQTVSYSSGSGTNTLAFSYTVQNGDTSADLNYKATSSLALNGATIRDAAGNNATLTLPALASSDSLAGNSALVIDGSAPTIAVSSDVSSLRAGETASLTFTLSDAATDFVETDIAVSGGSLSNWTAVSSTVYTATFTPTDNSTADGVISVASTKFSDSAGNTNNDGSDANNSVTFSVDSVRPTIAVSSDVSSLRAGETASLTFTLSDAATDFVETDIAVSGGSLSNWTAVSSTVYTATFTPTDNSTADGVISVASTKFSDSAGNTNNDGSDANNSVTFSVDSVRPTIAVSSDVSSLRAGETASLTFTLSDAATDFVETDIAVSGGSLSNWTAVSSTVYTATFTPTDNSTADGVISVASTKFSDSAGNTNNDGSDANNSVTFSVDSVRPTIAVSSDVSSLRAGETASLTFTLSDAATDFVETDIAVSGGSLSNWTAVSSTVYTATFTPTDNSTADGVISVASTKFSDSAGNTNNDGSDANNSVTFTVDTTTADTTPPTIAITHDDADNSLGAGDTSTLTFTLSDAATDFVETDIAVSGGSLSNWTAVSSTVYTATFTPTDNSTADGVISVASTKFSDSAGNTNNDGSDANNSVTFSVDSVRPTIAVSSDVSSLRAGETASLTFTLSDAATDFVETDIAVSGGSLSNWTAVSSTVYTATFTPTDNSTADGVISVASTKFSDSAGNTNNDGSDANNSVTFSVDSVRPTIAVSSDVSSLRAGETASLTFTLSDAATDFVETDIAVSGGSLSNWTAVSSTVYTATFTPTDNSTADGVISVASTKFSDSAGNTNNDGSDANNSVTFSVDSVRPTIAVSSDVSSLRAGETASLTFTLSDAATDFVETDIAVSGGSLSNWTAVSSTVYTATFTPTDNSTADGVISVASTKFSDSAGNTNNDGSDANNSVTFSVDSVRPTIAVSSDVSSLRAGETASLTFTLSDAATDFVEADVSITGGSLSNFYGTGSSYSATFTPKADSRIEAVIAVASGAFSNSIGNSNADGSDSNNSVTIGVDTFLTVSRLFNPKSNCHLSSANQYEIDKLTSEQWINEGIYSTSPSEKSENIYRFFNPHKGSHLYTSSDFEKDSIIASSEGEYIYEGVAFKAYSLEYGAANEKLEVIRFFNTQSNTHMYSSSEDECELLNESDLFVNEGIAWYTDFI